MFQTTVIASGSKGNCVLVRTAKTAVLLDAGVSAKRILQSLEALHVDREELKAIFLSHEHSDHSRSVGSLSRTLKIPLYITRDTLMQTAHRLGNLHDRVIHFSVGKPVLIEDLKVHPFMSSHDAIDSCNFTFECVGVSHAKLGVATDLGYPTKLCLNHLSSCSTLILESNHDEQMLMDGPYEWFLKQRVKGKQGHLSNLQAVGVMSCVMHERLKNLILAHLSEINNTPSLAENTMRNYLSQIRSDINLIVAEQNRHTPLINV